MGVGSVRRRIKFSPLEVDGSISLGCGWDSRDESTKIPVGIPARRRIAAQSELRLAGSGFRRRSRSTAWRHELLSRRSEPKSLSWRSDSSLIYRGVSQLAAPSLCILATDGGRGRAME